MFRGSHRSFLCDYIYHRLLPKPDSHSIDNEGDCRRALEIQQFIEEDSYLNLSKIACKQLKETSQLFKKGSPQITLTHVLDRGFDGNDYFEFIDEDLEDEFVIRLKLSCNFNEFVIDEKTSKKQAVKLKDVEMTHKHSSVLEEMMAFVP